MGIAQLDIEKTYGIREVADMLGVHYSTIKHQIERGELRAFRVGRLYRIPESAIIELSKGAIKVKDASQESSGGPELEFEFGSE